MKVRGGGTGANRALARARSLNNQSQRIINLCFLCKQIGKEVNKAVSMMRYLRSMTLLEYQGATLLFLNPADCFGGFAPAPWAQPPFTPFIQLNLQTEPPTNKCDGHFH